jgi:hypothetical protein
LPYRRSGNYLIPRYAISAETGVIECGKAAMDACARLRSGLEVSEQRAGEATVYVVKDPASGRIFRLPATAYFIARQLDGGTAPDEIRKRVEKEFGAARLGGEI